MLAPSKNVFCGLLATDVFFPIEKGGVALIVGDTASSASDMLTRLTLESDSDVNVVVLCGKSLNVIYSRLREYKTHMARQKTVFILSPQSDRFEMRKKSLESAFAVAEYFRETGLNVLLSIDTINAILELAPKNATLSCLTDLLKRAARTESAAKNASYASLTVVTTASQSLVAALEQIKSSVGTYIELECENCYPTNGSINFDGSFSKSNCRNASADGIVHALINISDGKDSESAYLARLALKAILNADFLSAHAKDVFDAQTLVSSERAFLDSVLRLCREAERSPTKCRQVLTDILSLCENITPEITEGTIT
ncbi:MAG: hypothetical protein IKA82_02160 [Clostridia bacterium]|nr:hypothetical protein [Clostridia bacterium]